MDLDFEKALTYISKDAQYGNKLLAGAGLMLASFAVFVFPFLTIFTGSILIFAITFVAAFLVSFVIWIAVSGYICETAHRRIENPDVTELPDWTDFGGLILLGCKYFLGYFLYILPVCLSGVLFAVLFGFGIWASHDGLSGLSVFTFLFLTLLGALLVFLYLLTMIFLPLMMANFFRDKKILSFINFKDAFSMLKNNVGNYLILILLFIAVTMLAQILCSFLLATIIGLILLPLVYMYIYFVIADLCAQFVNTRKETAQNNDAPSC